ncbi:hypothetical protein HanIR_Chr10g0456531 [Helianthus annuus]|nr:hypothetical protein HanIR_Chr10g0456531 [Helianthus annuus]
MKTENPSEGSYHGSSTAQPLSPPLVIRNMNAREYRDTLTLGLTPGTMPPRKRSLPGEKNKEPESGPALYTFGPTLAGPSVEAPWTMEVLGAMVSNHDELLREMRAEIRVLRNQVRDEERTSDTLRHQLQAVMQAKEETTQRAISAEHRLAALENQYGAVDQRGTFIEQQMYWNEQRVSTLELQMGSVTAGLSVFASMFPGPPA